MAQKTWLLAASLEVPMKNVASEERHLELPEVTHFVEDQAEGKRIVGFAFGYFGFGLKKLEAFGRYNFFDFSRKMSDLRLSVLLHRLDSEWISAGCLEEGCSVEEIEKIQVMLEHDEGEIPCQNLGKNIMMR